MICATTHDILYMTTIDVNFTYELPSEHSIHNIVFDPESPATLEFEEYVSFTFDYTTTNPGNVRIWGDPMTEGALTPDNRRHPSPRYNPPSGSGDGLIWIRDERQTETQHIDQVRFTMVCIDTDTTLLEIFEDVDFTYEPPSEHSIHNIVFTPATPATLEFGEWVNITFDYSTINPENVYIYVAGMKGGILAPNLGVVHSGDLSPNTGSGSGKFRILDDEQTDTQHVDQVRLTMYCTDTNTRLLRIFEDVDYTYMPPGFDYNFQASTWWPWPYDPVVPDSWTLQEPWGYSAKWDALVSSGVQGKWSNAWYNVREYRNFEYAVRMRAHNRNRLQSIIIRAGDQFDPKYRRMHPGYVFSYSHRANAYSIMKHYPDGTKTSMLAGWTATAAIVDGWNTLKVRAVDNRFDFYINDTLVETVFDSEFTVGKVGFAMWRDEGAVGVSRATLTVLDD